MKFSSFCWHVEDLYINSINYNHKGSAKVWYVIPSSDKEKFDSYVKSTNKQAAEKSHFLHSITFMVDPLELRAAGITVYKIRQTARSYVFTFPKVVPIGCRCIMRDSRQGLIWVRPLIICLIGISRL